MVYNMHSVVSEFKTCFLDRVYGFVDHVDVDQLLNEYIVENENRHGESFWDNFSSVKEAIDDFKQFVEYADECEWYYEE